MQLKLPGRAHPRARTRMHVRLQEDQQLLCALLKNVSAAIVAWGGDGRLAHASRRAEELFGARCPLDVDEQAALRELRPRTASGIALVPEDLPQARALSGETVRGLDVLVCVRGVDVLLCTRALPVRDRGGRRCGAVVLMEDVTERRREEARLRAAAAQAAPCGS